MNVPQAFSICGGLFNQTEVLCCLDHSACASGIYAICGGLVVYTPKGKIVMLTLSSLEVGFNLDASISSFMPQLLLSTEALMKRLLM